MGRGGEDHPSFAKVKDAFVQDSFPVKAVGGEEVHQLFIKLRVVDDDAASATKDELIGIMVRCFLLPLLSL